MVAGCTSQAHHAAVSPPQPGGPGPTTSDVSEIVGPALSTKPAVREGLASSGVSELSAPGRTSEINLIGSTTEHGYVFDQYRNLAYPCAVSGYQTFTIATRVGSSATETRPLWIYMHGGGAGYFDDSGAPRPDNSFMTEESAAMQRDLLTGAALTRLVAGDPAVFRMMAVSMCDRDLYGGADVADPNNPNTTPDGRTRTVNGLFSTKAAIQFALASYPTDDYFLYGTSAGAAGTFHIAWALEAQGIPPTGLVADSGVLSTPWQAATGGRCGRSAEDERRITSRLHPDVTAVGNDPDELVSSGRLTVPIVQVWVVNDPGQCGDTPIACPLRDGSTRMMGSVDCLHEPLRLALAARDRLSMSMRLCVDDPAAAGACDMHTPTQIVGAINTSTEAAVAFDPVIVDWVDQRLRDD